MRLDCSILALVALTLAGCQRYASRPLDFSAHADAWERRDVAGADVAAFSRQLAAARGVTSTFDAADGLTLDEAEVVALFFNPSLRHARLKARIPAVAAAEAGRWQDPVLAVDAERIIESVQHPWVIGGMLELTLPISGRLEIEGQRSADEAAVERARAYAAERALIAEFREAWLRWSANRLKVAASESMVEDLGGLLTAAEKMRDAGEAEPAQARLLQIERVGRVGRLRVLRDGARDAELAIKGMMGLTPEARVTLVPLASLPVDAAVRGSVDRHPRVAIAAAEYRVAERELELEIRKQFPDVTTGGGFNQDEGTHRVLFGLRIPLPLFNANRQAIAVARARRDAARAAAEVEVEQLTSETARARLAVAARADRVKYVETEVAPLVDRQLSDARRLGKLGEYNALLLLESLKAAHEAKFDLLDARLEAAEAANRLRALGETVVRPATQPVEVRP